jgi:penicillin-binding protein 1A
MMNFLIWQRSYLEIEVAMKRKKRTVQTVKRMDNASPKTNKEHSLKSPQKKKSVFWTAVISVVSVFFISIAALILIASKDLPSLRKLERIDPKMASQVYSADGELLYSFFRVENRKFVPFDQIPQVVKDALISTEDRNFYHHWGIDVGGIARAMIKNIIQLDLTRQGASTITMQLSRNLYFGFARKWIRKVQEAITSIQIEKTYSKKEILEMYLNITPFGNNAFGIKAASMRYFDKDVQDLTTNEAALLIGILKGQTYYSPIRHPQRALKRRNVVLSMMAANGALSKAEFDSLKAQDLNLKLNDPHEMKISPYFTEYVRVQLNKLQKELGVDVYEDGLKIYTSLNTKMQALMDTAYNRRIGDLQARVRGQSAFRRLKTELSDSAFNALTTLQIAFVALDPKSGNILAMIGGRDFNQSKFNRAVQMERQPGSTFKPFLYTAAIDNGYTPADLYHNQPTVVINPDGTRWTPKNYTGKIGGQLTLREALRRSINLVAVRLIDDITPQTAVQYAKSFGLSTSVRPFPSLALGGSCEVIPLELVSAYGTFANNGIHVNPVSILRIEDKHGNIIYQPSPEGRRKEVISPETNAIINSMLQDVIRRGTGYTVRSKFQLDYSIAAGGKTGTTNDNTNAWFVGYTPDIVAGVWVGLDDFNYNMGPGMSGAVAALPFWGEFMTLVYDSLNIARGNFPETPGIVKMMMCDSTHKKATRFCPSTYEEVFNKKFTVEETCSIHKGREFFGRSRRKRF